VSRRLASRAANAASHGLTATKRLPEILGPELLERHRQRFQLEWRPCTPTQTYLVEELARHAAALERGTLIEEAVLRTSARGLSRISDSDGDEDVGDDHVLAAACGAETVDRVTRYRRAHEKGDAGKSRCPSCGGADGKWLARRGQWQCGDCRRQVSARSGTVMERSRLSLRVWIAAIAAILQDRKISTEALCEITGIRRAKTVRALAQRIRKAIDSPNADRLLAGLNAEMLRELAGSRR
jgi:transposase-like protein